MSRARTDSGKEEPKRRPRRFGLGGFLLISFLVVALAVWFAPTVLIRTSMRDSMIQKALGEFPGRIITESASAGWISPIVINNAKVLDAQSGEVLTVQKIHTEKKLFALVLDSTKLGKITVDQPKLNLMVRDDGSNLEDLLRPILNGPKSSRPVGLTIEVIDGAIAGSYIGRASDPTATWSIEKLNAAVTVPGQSTAPYEASLKALVATVGQAPGQISANAQWKPSSTEVSAVVPFEAALNLETTGMPLELLNPWLRLANTGATVTGLLSASLDAKISADSLAAQIRSLNASGLSISAPALGSDRIELTSLVGRGEMTRAAGVWEIRDLNVQSDTGTIALAGTAPATSGAASVADAMNAVRQASGSMTARLDLARLAAMFPQRLHLQEGTRVESGTLEVQLVSQSAASGRTWQAAVRGDKFSATRAGRRIVWSQPITVDAVARESGGSLTVDQLLCKSSFLEIEGKGTLAQGDLIARGDLAGFVNEVGQMINFDGLHMIGQVQTKVQWSLDAQELVRLSGTARASNFEISSPSFKAWKESDLVVDFTSAGTISNGSLASLSQATLEVKAAGDTLQAQLRGPVSPPSLKATWPTRFKVQGNVARWLDRLQMFFTTPDWEISGQNLDLAGDADVSNERVELAAVRGTVKDFRAYSPSIFVRDPMIELDGSGAYDLTTGEFASDQATLSCTTIALRADRFRMAPQANGYAAEGNVQYRTNLERLSSWLHHPEKSPTFRLVGNTTGTMNFVQQNNSTQMTSTANIERFAYATASGKSVGGNTPAQSIPWSTVWEEPRLELSLKADYNAVANEVQVEKAQAAGEALSIGAQGIIQQPTDRCIVKLSGQYAYDLERLTERMRGVLGSQFAMKGNAARSFTLEGPLFVAAVTSSDGIVAGNTPAGRISGQSSGSRIRNASLPAATTPASSIAWQELKGEASVAWDSLVVQGFQIGKGELATKLDQGGLAISPIDLPVSEGQIRIEPKVDLSQSPTVVTITPGTVVDQVRITPEACRTWLKYLAPLVADATAAEGKFSVNLDDASFPASDPTGGNVQGQLVVHAAQIGPGPLATEIIQLAQQVRSLIDRRPANATSQSQSQWLEMPEQKLNFQLADHRVYHRDLQMAVKDITIRTQGWVGIDQQLALMAEIPVLDEWVANDRYLLSLKGQTIKLPIQGTLSRPQVDRRALAELGRQTVREAGTNFLQEQLNRGLERGLDRFFQPKAPPQNPAPATP